MEQRLIDANALKESFRKQTVNVQGKIKDDADAIIEAICKDVDLAPTVDAVQVVRCGECKRRYKPMDDDARNEIWCEFIRSMMRKDDFCSYGCADGERKVDADHVLED